ncbi:MAG TPA: response regulator [Longimicrobiales bacterium]|nr:response regulator [Longimicrobiales bacterium]
MKRPSALLVDGDEDTRTILRDALEHAGFDVHSTPSGAEGLALADAHRPDVIIGDFPLDVPGHSAFSDDIRANRRLTRTRLLAVTARAMEDEVAASRAAADAVLLKPVDPRVVVHEVRRLIGGN